MLMLLPDDTRVGGWEQVVENFPYFGEDLRRISA
jgi:hypothetical protein